MPDADLPLGAWHSASSIALAWAAETDPFSLGTMRYLSDRETMREELDRYVLPYRNRRVDQIVVDHALTLVLEGDVTVTIECPAMLSLGAIAAPDAAPGRLVPATQQVAKALALFGAEVLSSVAFKSGALRVVFSNGLHLNVRASDECEAWQVRGPDALRLVSLPGGELGVWQ